MCRKAARPRMGGHGSDRWYLDSRCYGSVWICFYSCSSGLWTFLLMSVFPLNRSFDVSCYGVVWLIIIDCEMRVHVGDSKGEQLVR